MGHDAVYFLAAAGGMVGSIWPAPGDFDFVLRIEHRLHFYGGGAVTSVAASGPHHFRYYHFQRVNSFRVRHRCDETRRTRETVRPNQRRVWTWIRNRARRGRLARKHEFTFSVLGRGSAEFWQCALRLFRAARITAAGTARQIRLAHGKSPGGAPAAELAYGTRGTFRGHYAVLPGS